MTLPRKDGGRGITDIKNLYNKQIKALREYFNQSNETTLHRAIVSAEKKYTPLNLTHENMTLHIKTTTEIRQEWANKPIQGKQYLDTDNTNVNKNASNKWLDRGELFRETEAYMVTIQDGVIPTRNYQKYMMKTTNIKDECRKCGEK
jgi:hypothetical protein